MLAPGALGIVSAQKKTKETVSIRILPFASFIYHIRP